MKALNRRELSFSPFAFPLRVVNAGNVIGRARSWKVQGTNRTYQGWHEEKLADASGCSIEIG
jgi:hypothetical protein